MNPAHFLAILRVETRKLFRHPAGRVGMVLAVLIGFAGPAAILWFGSSSATINGAPLSESLTYDAPTGIIWSLRMRNISHVLRLIILAMGALALAGELNSRTLREALLRPVPRWAIPVTKWFALCIWVAAANLATWVTASATGAILLGTGGDWPLAAKAMAVTTAGDIGTAAIVLLLAALTRSVAASIVLATMVALFNWGSRAFLYIVEQLAAQAGQPAVAEMTAALRPWLPTYALDGWTAYTMPIIAFGDDWWQPWITLTVVCAVCLSVTVARLQKLDVQ